jgi:hypothetical protein
MVSFSFLYPYLNPWSWLFFFFSSVFVLVFRVGIFLLLWVLGIPLSVVSWLEISRVGWVMPSSRGNGCVCSWCTQRNAGCRGDELMTMMGQVACFNAHPRWHHALKFRSYNLPTRLGRFLLRPASDLDGTVGFKCGMVAIPCCHLMLISIHGEGCWTKTCSRDGMLTVVLI